MPPSAATNRPRFDGVGAGERAAHVAEQLAVEQRADERAAVDRHERTARAPAGEVERARDQLLAGAALAGDQHGRVGLRDLVDRRAHLLHRRRVADHRAVREALGQLAVLAAQLVLGERALDDEAQLVGRERLADVVARAELHAAHGGVDRRIRGDQQHRGRRLAGEQLRQDRHAVLIGQVDVAQHEIELLARDRGDRTGASTLLRPAPGLHRREYPLVDDEDAAHRGAYHGAARAASRAVANAGAVVGVLRQRVRTRIRADPPGRGGRRQ